MRARTAAAAALGAALAAGLRWRRNPSACPYSQRFWLHTPRPLFTPARLQQALEARPGERVLEVGPGTGYYSLPVAGWLNPGGRLDVFDLQPEMLDHTTRAAEHAGLTNLHPTQGNARTLPYADASFDAAFLVTVLGEVPDQSAALRELRRVLKPTGRLVVGEVVLDPHVVTFGRLRDQAAAAGLRFERRVGGPLGFFARFGVA